MDIAPPSSLRPIFNPAQDHDTRMGGSPTPRPEPKVAVAPPAASMYEPDPGGRSISVMNTCSIWSIQVLINLSMCAERTQVTTISVLSNREAPVYEDHWVIVFGFLTDGHAVSSVLQEFQNCGNIDNWRYPPASNCNWMFIRFETTLGAQRALKKNGQRMGTVSMMIGVQPPSPDDRRFLQQQDDGVWESKGMGVAVPERKFVLATTTGKVSAVLSVPMQPGFLNG